jgi:hypothetical protein
MRGCPMFTCCPKSVLGRILPNFITAEVIVLFCLVVLLLATMA